MLQWGKDSVSTVKYFISVIKLSEFDIRFDKFTERVVRLYALLCQSAMRWIAFLAGSGKLQ